MKLNLQAAAGQPVLYWLTRRAVNAHERLTFAYGEPDPDWVDQDGSSCAYYEA